MSTAYIPIPGLKPSTGPLSQMGGAAAYPQFSATGMSKVDPVLQDFAAQVSNLVDQVQSLNNLISRAIQIPVFLGGANHQAGVVPDPGGAAPGTYLDVTGNFSLPKFIPQLFAALPAASAGLEGSIASVTNSTTATWGATITGGGAHHVLAYCNGTNWTVMGS